MKQYSNLTYLNKQKIVRYYLPKTEKKKSQKWEYSIQPVILLEVNEILCWE